MKKIVIFIFCLITLSTQAQNTFPISGNVGIGTISPVSELDLGTSSSDPTIYPNKITLWQGGPNNYFGFGISTNTLDYFSQGNHRFFTEYNGAPGSEKMVIKSSGNVGIGTVDPKHILHVKSKNQLVANFENPSTGTAEQTDAFTLFTNKYGSSQISSWQNFGTRIGSRIITAGGLGNVYFTTDNDVVRMMIQGTTGYLGISTVDPKYPLHIKNTNNFSANFENSSSGTGGATDAFVLFSNKYGSSQISSWQNFGTRLGSRSIAGGGAGNIYFTTGNDIERMIIREGTGNVGIGTSNPSYKLSVNGTIQAKEILVNTGWSDFVFDDNYKLRSLTEVEQFVKTNKHLPEIPSQKEVEKNGVQLGDISSKLLMKIEELTLYMIEMKKENEKMKNRIELLEKENTLLKN